jgi:membrane-associated phospholipid phosphatase
MMIAFAILIPVGPFIKELVNRPRPVPLSSDNLLLKTDGEPSFPSGHAMIVAAGAFIMLLQYNTGRKKLVISILLSIEALLVIYSRMYVGGHYPLDVIGGTLLGMGVGMAVLAAASSTHLAPLFTFLGLAERNASSAAK